MTRDVFDRATTDARYTCYDRIILLVAYILGAGYSRMTVLSEYILTDAYNIYTLIIIP